MTQSLEEETDYGLGTSFDPYDYEYATDEHGDPIRCPEDNEPLHLIPFANGPDDYTNSLYCSMCGYREDE